MDSVDQRSDCTDNNEIMDSVDQILDCTDNNEIIESVDQISECTNNNEIMGSVDQRSQNDALFVAFYDMRAVTFVLPDEMADVSIAGLQWFILIPRLNHTGYHRPIDSHSKTYLHQGKTLEQELLSLLHTYELRGKQPFVFDFSRSYDMP